MPLRPETQPPIRAVPMALFPTLGSLQDVINLAESKLPLSSPNEMFTLLMTYHNTLLLTQMMEQQDSHA